MSCFAGQETPKCPFCGENTLEEFEIMLDETVLDLRVETGQAESEKKQITCTECGHKFTARVYLSAIWEAIEEEGTE